MSKEDTEAMTIPDLSDKTIPELINIASATYDEMESALQSLSDETKLRPEHAKTFIKQVKALDKLMKKTKRKFLDWAQLEQEEIARAKMRIDFWRGFDGGIRHPDCKDHKDAASAAEPTAN